jgi:hypothetical protein
MYLLFITEDDIPFWVVIIISIIGVGVVALQPWFYPPIKQTKETIQGKKRRLKNAVNSYEGYRGVGIAGDKLIMFTERKDSSCTEKIPEELKSITTVRPVGNITPRPVK